MSSVLTLSLLGVSTAAAQPGGTGATSGETTATWTLVDYPTRICVSSASGRSSYLIAWPLGRWEKTITLGLRGLPPGSTSTTGVIAPGSGDGRTGLGGLGFTIPPTPVGVYDAAMWGSDGTVHRSVPVTFDVKERC
jgi:hypothetical protein